MERLPSCLSSLCETVEVGFRSSGLKSDAKAHSLLDGLGSNEYLVRDVLIFPDDTVERRKLGNWISRHHTLGEGDISDLIAAGTQTVVIGTGKFHGSQAIQFNPVLCATNRSRRAAFTCDRWKIQSVGRSRG